MAKKKESKVYSFLLLALLVFVVILIFYYLNLSKKGPEAPPSTPTTEEKGVPQADKIIEVPFDYVVKSVSAGQILINGERGDMYLPTDERIKIYKGTPSDNTPATIDDLVEGQKIRLKMIPGQAAWVYILE